MWLRSVRVSGLQPQAIPMNAIFILWHEHLPICIRIFSHLQIQVLISKSPDGNWAAQACQKFGFHVHRGSTSNGGLTGMRNLARALLKPSNISRHPTRAGMALDGPRGPYHEIKPGSLWLSQFSHTPVIPVFVHAKFGFRLNSWDKSLIPFPFSKVTLFVGAPFSPKNLDELAQGMRSVESLSKSA